MNKKILAVIAVVIIVAAGATVAFTMLKKEEPSKSYPDTHLTVLGNAELDDKFDSKDVQKIEAFINSGESFDSSKHYMMDANNDGKVDSDDVEKVKAILSSLVSNDWSAVGTVYYVNVDYDIATYDMTKSNKVITLIAPPLDSVLAMGGKDLVVGFDNRITTGKYHSEYARTFDFNNMYDVVDCNEPNTQVISDACRDLGSVNVVCGTKASYGPNLEYTFKDTNVQIIRIGSWEYGSTLYGFMTLGFLLKMTAGAEAYLDWYNGCHDLVKEIVKTVDPSKKSKGAAAAYGFNDELSLLGNYTGEYANLRVLEPFDSTEDYLHGKNSGGHGDTITGEGINAMYQQNNLRHLLVMLGAPFQVKTGEGNAQASQANFVDRYNHWNSAIGADNMGELDMCITGFSFSSGVSEVLNQLIHCYYLYNDEFLAYLNTDQAGAKDKIAQYVNQYCNFIGIDDLWSFYGEDNGGKAGTHGMNLLYCGEGDVRNIMYGPASGSVND